MNILMVSTNRLKSAVAPIPIGLAYIAKPLKDKGHSIKLLDMMFKKKPEAELTSAIDTFKPDAICFSMRNLDNQSMIKPVNPLPEVKKYISIAKDRNIPAILGGTAFTTLPKPMFEYMEADYGIAGHGEPGIEKLVEGIENKKVDKNIPGLVWRDNGITKQNEPVMCGYIKNEADWSVLDHAPYKNRSVFSSSVVTKIGCPYSCSYCDVKATWGNKVIHRDTDALINDFKISKWEHGHWIFWLGDACFNYPLDKSKELLRSIIKTDLKVYFGSVCVPDKKNYDDEFFELYSRAGGIFIMVGTETLSDTMLRNYNKQFSVGDILQFAQLAIKHGIHLGVEPLFGGPGETRETIIESMDTLKNIDYSLFVNGIGIRIVPQTELYRTALRDGFINSEDDLLFPKFYFSKDLDLDWTKKYIKQMLRKYWKKKKYTLAMFSTIFKIKSASRRR